MACFLSTNSFGRHISGPSRLFFNTSRALRLSISGTSQVSAILPFFNSQTMLSPKRLVEKAKKGLPILRVNSQSRSCNENVMVAKEGHFVFYTMDGTRFMVPLAFLKICIFEELLKVSAEEFGLPSEGPITLDCSGLFMEYILSMLKGSIARDVEKALLASVNANRCRDSSLVGLPSRRQRIIV